MFDPVQHPIQTGMDGTAVTAAAASFFDLLDKPVGTITGLAALIYLIIRIYIAVWDHIQRRKEVKKDDSKA